MAFLILDNIKSFFAQRFNNDRSYHIFFWILLFIFMHIVDHSNTDAITKSLRILINIGFFLILVYTNLLVLIPQYLGKKQVLLYIILFIALALLLIPPQILSHLLIFSNYPEKKALFLSDDYKYLLFLESIFVLIISSVFKISFDWWNHQIEKRELEKEKLYTELKFLKSQINPHFLFNTLNNLYALSLKKSDDAPEVVLKLAEIMRYMLYECNVKEVSLQKEIKYIENYLELEKIRQHKDLEISMTKAGKVNGKLIAPLLFIPFIENSFKHGLGQEIEGGFVHINLDILENHVEFKIENSIPTSEKQHLVKGKQGGIGLENIKRRLKLIYPNKHVLDIIEKENVYAVHLSLDLN